MSVSVRQHKGKWMVDIRGSTPDGVRFRDRRVAPLPSKTGALRWGQERERVLSLGLPDVTEKKEVPTLAAFEKDFIDGYARANQQKHASIVGKTSIFKVHLVPAMGSKKLDEITTADVDALKGRLTEKGRSAKRINDILTVLRTALKIAFEWDITGPVRAKIKGLKVRKTAMSFYEDHELEKLLEMAKFVDDRAHLVVLLGADAGLRAGEMLALRWTDCDMKRGAFSIARGTWRGVTDSTKGGEIRTVEMTARLRAALAAHRHARGPLVLYRPDGRAVSLKIVQGWMKAAQRLANVERAQPVHVLRHTFGTRLAAEGATPKQIQVLMGHASITTTLRYMHLSPASRVSAIRLLEKVGNT